MSSLKDKLTNSFVWKHKDAFLLFACVVLLYFQIFNKPKIQTVIGGNPLQEQQLAQLKDENGKMYAVIQQQTLDATAAKVYSDSLAKALKIKPKYIKGVERVIVKDSIVYETMHTLPVIIHDHDTAWKVEFHDPWSDIVAVAGRNHGYIKQEQRDTVTRVETVEGGADLFSKPVQHHIFLGNSNPHVGIFEGASFTVQEKKTWLTVGPYIGYDIITRKPSVGISAQIPIFQFKR